MCEHSKKLICWMDGELDASEAAFIETHVGECAECRGCLAAYEQASAGFDAYCDAVLEVAEETQLAAESSVGKTREQRPREILRLAEKRSPQDDSVKQKRGRVAVVGVGAMAAAAAIAMVLMLPKHRAAQIPASTTSNATLNAVERPANPVEKAPVSQIPSAPAATNHPHRRGAATVRHTQQVGESNPRMENASAAAETPIEIAVPTENMFPPGAVPAGIGFTAVVTISADDGAQSAGPRPRFAKVSNGGTQP